MHRVTTAIIGVACAAALTLGLGATTALASPPPPQWATQFASTGASLWPIGVGAFPDGTSVAGFQHWGGNGTINGTTITAATAVAKVSATGAVSWVAQPSDSASTARSISAGPDGTSVIVGLFSGSTTFGGTTLTSAGANDVFIAKLSAGGSWLWAKSVGGTASDDGLDVAVLSDGSILVTGNFRNTVTFGSTTLVSAGGQDIYVAKLNADGDWQWALRGGGIGNDSPTSFATTADGATAITGVFAGTIGGGTAPSFGSTTLSSLGMGDIYVATATPGGAWNWAVSAGSTGNDGYDSSEAVAFAPDGSLFLTGAYAGTMTLGSLPPLTRVGGDDLFVAKLTAAGAWSWAVGAGDSGTDRGNDIGVLPDGSAVMLGFFGSTSLTLGATTLTRASGNTGYNLAVARITATGTWDWAASIASSGSMSLSPASLTARPNGSLLVTGVFSTNAPAQTITLGSTVLTSVGTGANGFVTCLGAAAADCEALAAVPNAPQSVSASTPAGGSTSTSVSFTAPSANGSPILSYTATCTSSTGGASASQTGTASPLTVSGLTPGGTYTCTVTAANAVGTGTSSAASPPFSVPNTAPSSSTASAAAQSVERATGAADTGAPPTLRLNLVASTAEGAVVVFTAPEAGKATLVGTIARGSHASPVRACATAKRVRRAGPVKLVCTLRSDLRASPVGSKLTLVTTFRPKDGKAVSSSRTIRLRGDRPATAPPPTG